MIIHMRSLTHLQQRVLILITLALSLSPTPAQAFFKFFQKKKAVIQAARPNPEIMISEQYSNSQDANSPVVLDLRIAIRIPPDQAFITITTLYDEVTENPIELITWVRESGKNKTINRIKPFKIDQVLNQNMESIAIEYNPTLAYDRIYDNKHIINKTFYFNQLEVFDPKIKADAQYLEIFMPGAQGTKTKSIRIDDRLYAPIAPIVPIPQATAPVPQSNHNFYNPAQNPDVGRSTTPTDADINKQQQEFQQLKQQMELDPFDDPYSEGGDFEDDEEF